MLTKRQRKEAPRADESPSSTDLEEAEAARKQRRRDQVRVNQRNLRQRQRMLNGLEADVKTIELEIAEYDKNLQQLRNLSARDDFIVSNFAQYLHLHLYGVLPTHPGRVSEQRRISRFLFRDDVIYGGVVGHSYIEDQWLKWAGFHPKFKLVPTGFEVMHSNESAVIRVPVEITFVMTRLTIEAMYPHILAHEGIVQQILGHEFSTQAGFIAYYDEYGQIERMETWADLATTFSEAIGTLGASALLSDSEYRDTSHIRGVQAITATLYRQLEAMQLDDATPQDAGVVML
ncbi:hypothetical protein SPRG_02130 [Saprolegnia parasitica CBS 223.65]|uniref:BZIP domain-containing protein n=1 Tax=Saprolegnia parasitica (strain CBS 223.65) TaxID=695850 RepID=A0A067D3L5_SAPPC|nr:hypothetical protein SPRG_02130 [Saprolegnia parasitica CBS 223.65]KDO33321.1 hypothetical protein SPRG_02130 [Saprolegnia parasitica CBS 223.65]|eukprot:XP_012196071.1 hypothetical protein SPRG_02130 [Saprolegnia parasitica CBS 223.65]